MPKSQVEKPYLILLAIVGIPAALMLLWASGIIQSVLGSVFSAIWAVASPILTGMLILAVAPFALMLLAVIFAMSK